MGFNADRQRIINEFIEIISIDSPSHNERKMADLLLQKLENMGYHPVEDHSGNMTGGNSGNIICNIPAYPAITGLDNQPLFAPVFLISAHMDTVTPCEGKKITIKDGIISTDKTTILGSDDGAGIAAILEALRIIKESNIRHTGLQVVFTIAEETGLTGSKSLDYITIKARYGLVLDGDGRPGKVAVKAPSQYKIDAVFTGKAAHAGIEPENGINAIEAAALAISSMKLGRIDAETTANVGVINGGRASNIVCDKVLIKAEARSRDMKKLEEQKNHMLDCLYSAGEKTGCIVDTEVDLMYPSFVIDENCSFIKVLKEAAIDTGIELELYSTGGGSDTNIFNGKGIQSVDLSVGMQKVHSVDEFILVEHLIKTAEFLAGIVSHGNTSDLLENGINS